MAGDESGGIGSRARAIDLAGSANDRIPRDTDSGIYVHSGPQQCGQKETHSVAGDAIGREFWDVVCGSGLQGKGIRRTRAAEVMERLEEIFENCGFAPQ